MLVNLNYICIEKSRLRLLNAQGKKQTISNCASSDKTQMFMARIKILSYLRPKYNYSIYSPTYWTVTAIFVTCLTSLFLMSIINLRCMSSKIVQAVNLLPRVFF